MIKSIRLQYKAHLDSLVPQDKRPPLVKSIRTEHKTNMNSLIPQDEKSRRRAFIISRHAFEGIFNTIKIPVRFLEVMANNNGCYQARITYAENGVTESLRELSFSLVLLITSHC